MSDGEGVAGAKREAQAQILDMPRVILGKCLLILFFFVFRRGVGGGGEGFIYFTTA